MNLLNDDRNDRQTLATHSPVLLTSPLSVTLVTPKKLLDREGVLGGSSMFRSTAQPSYCIYKS